MLIMGSCACSALRAETRPRDRGPTGLTLARKGATFIPNDNGDIKRSEGALLLMTLSQRFKIYPVRVGLTVMAASLLCLPLYRILTLPRA